MTWQPSAYLDIISLEHCIRDIRALPQLKWNWSFGTTLEPLLGQKLVPKFLLRKGAFEISPTLEPLQNFDHIMDTYQ